VTASRQVTVGGRSRGLPPATVRRVVRAVLAGERREALISVTFLGPVGMRRLNAAHRKHNRPTDVLSFGLALPGGELAGDVYICPAVASEQAKALGVPPREELVRLVVHGVLHALGHDHPEGRGRESSAMWRRQERYVRKLARA
jgi:probable rRNA maturation factor